MSFSSLWKGDNSKRMGSQSQPVSLSSSPTSPGAMPPPVSNGKQALETHSSQHLHHLQHRAVNSRLHGLLHQSQSPAPGGGFSSNPSLPIEHARRLSSYGKSPQESPVTAPASPLGGSLSQTPVKETHHISIDYDPVSGRKTLNTYEIIRELGRGQHGKVKLGRNMESGEYVAIKVVDRTGRPRLGRKPGSTQEDKIRREIAILKKCSHPNIVQLKEVLDDSTSKKIYLVLEYLEKGEVEWQTEDGGPAMTRKMAKTTARDVLLGLEYLHFQGIIHRDIKPANLLLSADGRVKISDFGVSYVSNEGEDEFELAKTAGTPAFFAPELCVTSPDVPRPTITNKIDVWAFGVTLFCLLYGTVPFYADSEFELFDVIVNQSLVFPDEMTPEERKKFTMNSTSNRPLSIFYNPKHAHEEASSRKNSVLSTDTNDTNDNDTTNNDTKTLNRRPSALLGTKASDTVLSVPTEPTPALETDADLELAKDLIRKLLEKDPVTRITVIEAKSHPWLTDGMETVALERYLSGSGVGCNDKIEVTGDELQAAVQGITGKIKRGLSRFGSTALSFAGLRRRKSSTSSIASSTTRKGRSIGSTSAANSRSNSRDPFGNSPSDTPIISTRHSVAGLPKRHSDHSHGHAAQPPAATTVAAAAAAAATTSFVEYQPLVRPGGNSSSSLHDREQKRGLPASSSNFNLNSLLEGEVDNTRRPSQTQLARSPLSYNHSRTSSMARSPGFSSSVVTSASSSMSSSSSSSGDEDDNGELTLVLGPPRGREASPSSARMARASESALRPPRLRQDDLIQPQGSAESIKSPTSTISAETNVTATTNSDDRSVTRFRSRSITVGILQRSNDN